MIKYIRIRFGNMVRKLGKRICGNYWRCCHCGKMKFREEEILCWGCGIGKMLYQG